MGSEDLFNDSETLSAFLCSLISVKNVSTPEVPVKSTLEIGWFNQYLILGDIMYFLKVILNIFVQ